jgi:hypothetical protein
MHRAEPAHPEQVRKPARVVAVGLHRHGGERLMRLAGFHQHRLNAMLGKAAHQPFRHRACFQADALQLVLIDPQCLGQGIWTGRHFDLADELAVMVHHAQRGLVQRHVERSIQPHGSVSSWQQADSLAGKPPDDRISKYRDRGRAVMALAFGVAGRRT